VGVVMNDVSGEHFAFIIRATRISKLGTMLAITTRTSKLGTTLAVTSN
jgi:hypothetical protein